MRDGNTIDRLVALGVACGIGIALASIGMGLYSTIFTRTVALDRVTNRFPRRACPPELNLIVMGKLSPEIEPGYFAAMPEVLQKQARAQCIRDWAKALPKDQVCLQEEYLGWLDFYGGKLKAKKEELEARIHGQPDEDPLEPFRQEKARADDYAASHPLLAPPEACERDLLRKVK